MAFSSLDSALFGPLFVTPQMAAVFSERAQIAAMLRMETALARAEAALGIVPAPLAQALAAISPDDLDIPALGQVTAIAGVPVIPFAKAVQALLPRDLEPAFHKGATTQDVFDTALALQMTDAFALLAQDLAATLTGLAALAEKHRATACAGRTYGQHAAPVSFGYKAAIWMAGLADVAAALPALRPRVCAVSLGGPVGTLSGLGLQGVAVMEAMAADLGLSAPAITWHTLRGRVAEAGSWLCLLIGALAKFAGDVAHLASTEVGEVEEPFLPGRGGSSAMPHKRNPVGATVILAAQAAAKGHLTTLLDAMAAAHERPAGLWHGEWHALPQLFGLASGALVEARRLAEGLVVDEARMRRNLDLTGGLLFTDAVAARLAPGLGRAAAHHRVEEFAAIVRDTGRTLQQVLEAAPDLPPELSGAALAALFDPSPALQSAGPLIDRALTQTGRVIDALQEV
jgi:3-carboxy-cis,cis-muconate cycloisomerase